MPMVRQPQSARSEFNKTCATDALPTPRGSGGTRRTYASGLGIRRSRRILLRTPHRGGSNGCAGAVSCRDGCPPAVVAIDVAPSRRRHNEVFDDVTARRTIQIRRTLAARSALLAQRIPWLRRWDVVRALAQTDWKNIEYFDRSWRLRVEQMARFIPAEASVMDLGCGERWLSEIVGSERYTGVDYRSRSPDTVVCDFDRDEFPDIFRDVAFVSGCLEYVRDYPRFIAEICRRTSLCILSYCPIDTHRDFVGRRRAGWRNDLTIDAIDREFGRHGFAKTREELTASRNAVLVFRRAARDG